MTSPPPAGDSLDNPIFWHEFLKRLSFCDIEYARPHASHRSACSQR